ncbi:MAG: CapA family protein [Paludibacteraceae bacterium]
MILILHAGCKQADKQKQIQSIDIKENNPFVLVFAGDVMHHHIPQLSAAYDVETQKIDYKPCFQYIKSYIETADIAFCNLEFPLAGKPYSGYPSFSGPDEMLDALQWSGFDIFQLANNHIIDKGYIGLDRTIDEIKNRDLEYVGAYGNSNKKNEKYPLIINKNNVRFAILNYTYNTNKANSGSSVVNKLDTASIIRDIRKAKMKSADIIIATVHWGTEYQLSSDEYQQKWADFFVRYGADLIIGSHPHVVQNAEIKEYKTKKVPVFYSLGNFISNQRKANRNGGILARVEIDVDKKIIKNVSYLPFYVLKGILRGKYQFYLLPTDEFLRYPSLYPISNKSDSTNLIGFHRQTQKTLQNISSYLEVE